MIFSSQSISAGITELCIPKCDAAIIFNTKAHCLTMLFSRKELFLDAFVMSTEHYEHHESVHDSCRILTFFSAPTTLPGTAFKEFICSFSRSKTALLTFGSGHVQLMVKNDTDSIVQ